eukprot:CAMPEP_0197672440 /NCGR_PEP_ID=MMETSP1338-20131121/78941_1 /TAXON_ID=43686 ORGANISM="Pelagodinium beii, Strain RCC1491" /NCGR_SAMPLE_ID=MMETSP1338 /ASSEMBLY_ACC=CAM_ASM_000754 /LENGTH=31 /DNA_ID= /DNA_START= /DNA_END= /DNA_ORIENTATION=
MKQNMKSVSDQVSNDVQCRAQVQQLRLQVES